MNTGRIFLAGTVLFLGLGTGAASAGSLSASLGATNLNGLTVFSDCVNRSVGYREKLIADRLEARLANTPALTPQDRGLWLAEINALRQVTAGVPYRAPDPNNPQRYLAALTNDEQVAINSLTNRNAQEINLECEQKYGGVLRYSPTSDQSGQTRYENELRSKMEQPLSLDAVPLTPLPSLRVKTLEEQQAEQRAEKQAKDQAMKQVFQQKMAQCQDQGKGLQMRLTAEALQRKLDGAQGLSDKDRTEFQADVQAAWASAGKGLNQIEPVDPKNPHRALMRLSPQEQMEVATEFGKQYTQMMQNCARV